jgi:hypothetical protein
LVYIYFQKKKCKVASLCSSIKYVERGIVDDICGKWESKTTCGVPTVC